MKKELITDKLVPVLYADTIKRYPLARVEIVDGPGGDARILLHGEKITAFFGLFYGELCVVVDDDITGPEKKRVKEVIHQFYPAYFEAMQDCKEWCLESMEEVIKRFTVCPDCGRHVLMNDTLMITDVLNDRRYRVCRDCAYDDSKYNKCGCCCQFHPVADMVSFDMINGAGKKEKVYQCITCYKDALRTHIKCEICGALVDPSETFYHDNKIVCECCHPDFLRCDECGLLFFAGDTIEEAGRVYCSSCHDRYLKKKEIHLNGEGAPLFDGNDQIFSYHNAPPHDMRFYCSKGYTLEARSLKSPYIGIEYEVDGVDYEDTQIYIDYVLYIAGGLGHFESDSSTDEGAEFIMEPVTLAYAKDSSVLRDVIDYACQYMTVSDCDGIHMHVSRDYFGGRENQMKSIAILAYWLWRFKDDFLDVSGRPYEDGQYYGPRVFNLYEDSTMEEVKDRMRLYNDGDRYHNLNIQNRKTIEFRLFASTLSYYNLIEKMELIDTLCRKARSYTIARAAGISSFKELTDRKTLKKEDI